MNDSDSARGEVDIAALKRLTEKQCEVDWEEDDLAALHGQLPAIIASLERDPLTLLRAEAERLCAGIVTATSAAMLAEARGRAELLEAAARSAIENWRAGRDDFSSLLRLLDRDAPQPPSDENLLDRDALWRAADEATRAHGDANPLVAVPLDTYRKLVAAYDYWLSQDRP